MASVEQLKELIKKITAKVHDLRGKNEELQAEIIKVKSGHPLAECWAKIPLSECPYQTVGGLTQVNTYSCKTCSKIKFDKKNLFAAIEKIFEEEIEEEIEEGTEDKIKKGVEEKLDEEKQELLEEVNKELQYILGELENLD